MGVSISAQFIAAGLVTVTGAIADLANISDGSSLYRFTYVQVVEAQPTGYTDAYIPTEIGPQIAQSAFLERGLIREVCECLSLELWDDQQRVEAVVADREVAPELGVEIGSPLLLLTRLMLTQDEKFGILFRTRFRPDLYYYSIKLPRPPRNKGRKPRKPSAPNRVPGIRGRPTLNSE